MALIPSTTYSGQVDVDATHYPLGKARNISIAGANDGTPLEKNWVNDWWGFQQALLAAASITPSGDADMADASQALQAIQALILAMPNRVVERGQYVAASPISESVSSSNSPRIVANSTFVTGSLLLGDIVDFEFSQILVDNPTATVDALVKFQFSQNGGAWTDGASYKVAAGKAFPVLVSCVTGLTGNGTLGLRLLCEHSYVGAPAVITSIEQNNFVAKYIVYRPF